MKWQRLDRLRWMLALLAIVRVVVWDSLTGGTVVLDDGTQLQVSGPLPRVGEIYNVQQTCTWYFYCYGMSFMQDDTVPGGIESFYYEGSY